MKMVDWEVAKADFGGGGGKTEIGTEFKGSRVSLTSVVPSLILADSE